MFHKYKDPEHFIWDSFLLTKAMLPSSIPAAEHALTMIVLTFKHSNRFPPRPLDDILRCIQTDATIFINV